MVLVFKTNVRRKAHSASLLRRISGVSEVTRCNFDLQDRDRILRVAGGERLCPREIEQLLVTAGFACEELP